MEEEFKNEEPQEVKEESEEVAEKKKEPVAEEKQEAAVDEGQEAPTEEKPLDKMTVKELREVGKEIPELTGVTAMKKDELLAAIKKARGIEDEAPPEKKKKSD